MSRQKELAPSTEVVHAPSTEATPTARDTSTSSSEEGASLSEASLDRTAVANQVALLRRTTETK